MAKPIIPLNRRQCEQAWQMPPATVLLDRAVRAEQKLERTQSKNNQLQQRLARKTAENDRLRRWLVRKPKRRKKSPDRQLALPLEMTE